MKRLIFIVLLLAVVPCTAQDNSDVWGTPVYWGNTFTGTDSTRIRAWQDSLMQDTLYTDMLRVSDRVEGTYHISFAYDSISGASSSIGLDVRFFYGMEYKSKMHPDSNVVRRMSEAKRWTPWYSIYSGAALDSMRVKELADSSWWKACVGLQYRTYEADADTCAPFLQEFRN